MPFKEYPKRVQRGTICKDRWTATVRIIAPDRIAPNQPALLFVSITWRDERNAAGRPSDAKPVRIEFQPQRAGAGGDIVFDSDSGPRFKEFSTDVETVLTIFGKGQTAGQPDVLLTVSIEGEAQTPKLPMSVGTPDITVRIEKVSGGPPPSYLPVDHTEQIKAVVTPATQGTFQWVAPVANTLEFTNATPEGQTDVKLRRAPQRSIRFLPAVVIFKPQGQETVYMGVHQFDARESIAFVMGAPEPLREPNLFYRGATAYLTLNPIGQLEPNARSLQDVKNFLANHAPANGLPWGDVHIVVHASEEGFLQTPIVPGGRDADPLTIQPFVTNGELSLPDNLLDRQSVIRIRGCAAGRSQVMLESLSKAFGGNDPQRPVVRAPKHLQSYEYTPRNWGPGGQDPTSADEFLMELFLLGFPTSQVPNDRDLRAQFAATFPGTGINWNTVAFETRVRRFQVDDGGWQYIPIPQNDAQLAAAISAQSAGGRPVTNPRVLSQEPADEGRTRFNVAWKEGGQDFRGFFEAGPMPPTDLAGRLALLRKDLRQELGQDTGDRLFDTFSWTPTPRDVSIGPSQRQFTISFAGSRTVRRFSRELRENGVRAHPPVTDLRYFGAEIPQ